MTDITAMTTTDTGAQKAMAGQGLSGFDLSPQQRHLWLLVRESGEAAFRCHVVATVRGAFEDDVLRGALRRLVERHEILRTSFRCLPGMTVPLQVVADGVPHALVERDFRDLAPDRRAAATAELFGGLAAEPLDLERGPALRAGVALVGDGERRVWLETTALCADRATLSHLVRELAACCLQGATGREPGEAPLQYPDVAAWQNELLLAEDREVGRAWWRSRWPQKAADSVRLSFEREWASGPFVRAGVERWIEPRLLERLERTCERLDVALEDLLQAAWMILLRRFAEGGEPVVAREADGRRYEDLRESLGPLARFLPLPLAPAAGERFADFVGRLAVLAAEAKEWQEYFAWERADGAGDETERPFPLFAFSLADEAEPIVVGAAAWIATEFSASTERFRLALACTRGGGGLAAALRYDGARFRRNDVLLLSEQLASLLGAIAETPRARMEDLRSLGVAEAHRLLVELNDSHGTVKRGLPFPLQFVVQAERFADHIAAIAGGETVTYAELSARARRLAGHLRALGVGPEVRVGLCVERSLDTVVGFLGVLAAGGTFVPLDPSYPPERLRWMLANSKASVVLSHREVATRLGFGPSVRTVLLDADWEAIARAAEAPTPTLDPANLAYVIYTSGSTGRPKGVMVTHGGLSNYLGWCSEAYFRGAGRSCPVHSPIGFDLTITSLLGPLLEGRAVEMLPEEPGVETLASLLGGDGDFAFVKLTPAHLQLLRQRVPAERAGRAARAFIVGGEPLRGETVAFWRENAPGMRVINEYGPTEAVVGCCVYEVPASSELLPSVPIGRPIPNVRLYVLDRGLDVAPSQHLGELYIAGVGLARGYLDRSDLTAERFVPDPFSATPGGRLYRTGDLVRTLPTGDLDFVGRIDRQVKIRGYRIELGEVEAVLAEHPAVADVAVLVGEDFTGVDALLAFYVPAVGASPTVSDLRDALRARLPEPMIPASFTRVEAMPLTATGKVDPQRLLAIIPAGGEPQLVAGPGTPTEELLAGIWSELVRLDRIAPGDNFFEVGGHSLMATQLLSRIRRVFEVDLPMRALFESPTLSGMSARIAGARLGAAGRSEPPIVRVPREGALPLSFAQQRLWFLDRLEPGNAAYIVPTSVRLAGRLNVAALAGSVDDLVRRHESLRTRFPGDGEPVQAIDPWRPIAPAQIDLSALPDPVHAARAIARAETESVFDLARGPLWRVRLLRLGADDHVFLFTMHHIISDAWSKGVLVAEVAATYRALAVGLPPPMPEPAIQYADFATWQRAWLQGDVFARQIGYWRSHLEGVPQTLALPTDRPRPSVPSLRGAFQPLAIPDELYASLRALARREGATLFMTLLAAFEVVLSDFARQADFVVGANIANRNRAEVEGLIGFFVNLLPLRADLAGDPEFREVLARVRTAALGAYESQDVPFEVLVHELKVERVTDRAPLVQVVFTFQTVSLETIELSDLALTPFSAGNDSVKFDLVLVASEQGGRLSCALMYQSELFFAATVAQLLRHLELCLNLVVEDPEIRQRSLAARFAEDGERQAREDRDKFNHLRRDRSRQARPIPVRAQVVSGGNEK